jgi:hypothetical protein
MGLIASSKGGTDFALHPTGSFPARCIRIIDLGTHESPTYVDEKTGKPKKAHKVMLAFETSAVHGDDDGEMAGKPFRITTRYTLSLHKKASLRGDLESWRGRPFTPAEEDGFELKNLLGKACMLSIIHSEDGKFANIKAIMQLPGGMTAPQPSGELVYFSIDDFDAKVYEGLSERLKETIAKSDEYRAKFSGKRSSAPAQTREQITIDDDDIPF